MILINEKFLILFLLVHSFLLIGCSSSTTSDIYNNYPNYSEIELVEILGEPRSRIYDENKLKVISYNCNNILIGMTSCVFPYGSLEGLLGESPFAPSCQQDFYFGEDGKVQKMCMKN